jgi:Na+-translocating ferredoxin:NAD+ oxidoreductase subunit B
MRVLRQVAGASQEPWPWKTTGKTLRTETRTLVDRINALLPQTQCTKCGYDGCKPYAQAIAEGQADINRCPPGSDIGVAKLSALLNIPAKPIDPQCGSPGPRQIAVINEEHCIGCTLCLAACPVDAIMGANKRMHTVIQDWCTGCDLCLPPCPVDCIDLIALPGNPPWTEHDAALARERFERREARLDFSHTEAMRSPPEQSSLHDKHSHIAAALAKARARRAGEH